MFALVPSGVQCESGPGPEPVNFKPDPELILKQEQVQEDFTFSKVSVKPEPDQDPGLAAQQDHSQNRTESGMFGVCCFICSSHVRCLWFYFYTFTWT